MNAEEVGIYHGYRVILERDEVGWRTTATAGHEWHPVVCWSHRREQALDLIRASIDLAVSDERQPELMGSLSRLP